MHVQRYRVVLHEGNIQSVLTVELDIGTGEQFDALFVQSAWEGCQFSFQMDRVLEVVLEP